MHGLTRHLSLILSQLWSCSPCAGDVTADGSPSGRLTLNFASSNRQWSFHEF